MVKISSEACQSRMFPPIPSSGTLLRYYHRVSEWSRQKQCGFHAAGGPRQACHVHWPVGSTLKSSFSVNAHSPSRGLPLAPDLSTYHSVSGSCMFRGTLFSNSEGAVSCDATLAKVVLINTFAHVANGLSASSNGSRIFLKSSCERVRDSDV